MNNAVEHAYISQRPDTLNINDTHRRHWHLFSWIRQQGEQNDITVVFCDLGVGIPVTLPDTDPEWGRVHEGFLKGFYIKEGEDGAAIRHAIMHGRTTTGAEHRGKGLPQLVENVEKIPGARLTILSNRGAYNYESGRSWVPRDFADSILGTLIAWTFPIARSDIAGADKG